MDPNNGDVLALASCPTYDPNMWMRKISPDEWAFLSDPVLKPQINRAMQENYAPGSIFKVVIGLAALDAGLDPDQKIYSPGWIRVPGRRTPIDDLAPAGEYDFHKAFIHSSNTYFITNGMQAGIEAIIRLGMKLHLGERTGLLPNQETPGILPTLQMVRRGWIHPTQRTSVSARGACRSLPCKWPSWSALSRMVAMWSGPAWFSASSHRRRTIRIR
jgi:penicillin-binding protein 2